MKKQENRSYLLSSWSHSRVSPQHGCGDPCLYIPRMPFQVSAPRGCGEQGGSVRPSAIVRAWGGLAWPGRAVGRPACRVRAPPGILTNFWHPGWGRRWALAHLHPVCPNTLYSPGPAARVRPLLLPARQARLRVLHPLRL